MKFYRVKQFLWAVVSKITDKDREYIGKYLDASEKELFFNLSKSEQKHSIRVAHKVEELVKFEFQDSIEIINTSRLRRAALLHDIGKKEKKLNAIDKSILVILNKITKGRIKKFTNIKKIDVYYNHAEKGFNILKNTGKYDERFLFLVRNHHKNDIIGDVELAALKKADSLS